MVVMKPLNVISCWFYPAFLALFFSYSAEGQIGAKANQTGDIHGLWQNSQFGYQMTLQLNADGSGEFDGEPIHFVSHANKLTITVAGTETIYTYTLQGNSMTLAGGDLDGEVSFVRNASDSSENSEKGGSTISPAFSNTSRNLLGLWSGNGEMIEFRPDGKCVYLGNTFPYQVSQGRVVLTTGQGPVAFEYVVKGSQLTMIVNGQKVLYMKAAGTTPPRPAPAGKGEVAMELVGEWCYMNMNTNSQSSRCITLRADGTYYYTENSSRSVNTNALSGGTASQGEDRGTWSVQGDRLYYHSQANGDGSYRLEKRNHPKNVNDPMIVLDGEAYVTTTSRSPWR
jgi:hypothetical protein